MVPGRSGRRGLPVTTSLAAAYSATGSAWQRGPGPIYDRLAAELVARAPESLDGRRVLDVGAGTGAASRALMVAGARDVVAVDAAVGMLAYVAADRPPAAAGDARALPFADRSFDAAVAAFSLNHLTDPATGLREMARVTRRGGALLAANYGTDDTHPVKAAVEAALARRGWTPDAWYYEVRDEAAPRLATVEDTIAVGAAAGLDVEAELVHVPFGDLATEDLVAWRLGMAHHAPFVEALRVSEHQAVVHEAIAGLGQGSPSLVRSIVVLRAVVP